MVHQNYDLPGFCRESEVATNHQGERLYSTPSTGQWWNDAQVDPNVSCLLFGNMIDAVFRNSCVKTRGRIMQMSFH